MPNGVRLARTSDLDAVAALQWESWTTREPHMAEAAQQADLDVRAVADLWRDSLLSAQEPAARLFVATDTTDQVVGFAATAPAQDPDADASVVELLDLVVHPNSERAGHGSRLLAAVAETLAKIGYAEIVVWRSADDATGQAFLSSAGFNVDGARRELASDYGQTATQIRMSVATVQG